MTEIQAKQYRPDLDLEEISDLFFVARDSVRDDIESISKKKIWLLRTYKKGLCSCKSGWNFNSRCIFHDTGIFSFDIHSKMEEFPLESL